MSTSINLAPYRAIHPAYFVEIDIDGYAILRFSDLTYPYTLNGDLYSNIGQLLSISSSASEVRATESQVSVSISGVPAGSVAEILNNNPKGSPIVIQRGFFNPTTNELLNIAGNPATKFSGMIFNYAMEEEWDSATRTSSFSITFICQSIITTLKKKIGGRRTNPSDQEAWTAGDLSMSRVPTVMNSNFQFGAPAGTLAALN